VKPTLLPADHPPAIRFTGGRHPTLEATLDPGAFVPNSVDLRHDGIRALVITGPNMGGKSCFIRQVALLALMSQMGSYVPAASAELTVLDGVYTRMGASDNLAMGSSTFLEEMSECSSILNEATSNSLVVSFIFFEFLMAIRMT
jgi:DNA mismatch repair protein MSH3